MKLVNKSLPIRRLEILEFQISLYIGHPPPPCDLLGKWFGLSWKLPGSAPENGSFKIQTTCTTVIVTALFTVSVAHLSSWDKQDCHSIFCTRYIHILVIRRHRHNKSLQFAWFLSYYYRGSSINGSGWSKKFMSCTRYISRTKEIIHRVKDLISRNIYRIHEIMC